MADPSPEQVRLREAAERSRNWKRWGPYLAERQWGTVREDYSADGNVWGYFPFEHAHRRAYRWGEDGLLGITDRECRLCFAVALWNGRDRILKERLFGLTPRDGNHGEDVKECYWYLDATPTHSLLKARYRYPQAAFPYEQLIAENRRRTKADPEYELLDTGVLDGGRFFDVDAEYAKAGPNDILIRLRVTNCGPQPAAIHVLPTLWFRDTWTWDCTHEGCTLPPRLARVAGGHVLAEHESLGRWHWCVEAVPAAPELLFTHNESNLQALFGVANRTPWTKDAFHRWLIEGHADAVNPAGTGTKAAAVYRLQLAPAEQQVLRLRLCADDERPAQPFGPEFDATFALREREADEFHAALHPPADPQAARVVRAAHAGLLWNQQFYSYSVRDWLAGDPAHPEPPAARRRHPNAEWTHLFNRDVISMPDKWEFPWYAAWDLAFHMIPFARLDPDFARDQLVLLLREWYMHPSGQLPAYEFNFSDVNPPVHAFACWRVYLATAEAGRPDHAFLARTFHKLLLNFTWWVNRKDPRGRNVFAGGFLGLDNIGVFDRSQPLPGGGQLEQADGTAWMAGYCLTMLAIALELAHRDPTYEDVASKFFEHFVAIADAMNTIGGSGLWDEQDGFYYDQITVGTQVTPLRIRSLVGLIPLIVAGSLDDARIGPLRGFRRRMQWFIAHRPDLWQRVSGVHVTEGEPRWLIAIPSRERLERVLRYMLDEREFLSPFGIRSLSRIHADQPFAIELGGHRHEIRYAPAESDTDVFGGNSNWRGPVWLPINFLLIDALERYHAFWGDALQVEFPTGSGRRLHLAQVAGELARRVCRLFLPGPDGRRPCMGPDARHREDPHWRDLLWFHEYFHGDDGRGLGASHQTGWTALVAELLRRHWHFASAAAGG